ncbi:Oxysterol-binding protein- protein 3 [Gryganskiella cystojenkinii]|nr:Oxysterol-binding protein- protein 3 [Gryganskiella cystojenkinii]
MQEIEVPARDVFQHYVHVDQPQNKALVWWFSTKKKNISFGLYFRKSSAVPSQLKSSAQAPSLFSTTGSNSIPAPSPSGKPDSIASSRHNHSSPQTITGVDVLSTSPTKSSRASNYASSRASIDTASEDEDDDHHASSDLASALGTNQHNPSQSSLPATTSQPSSRKKKTVAKFKDPDLIEILPIQHYDSASATIRGEYTIKDEGSYVLVFDNSFSVHTSKRLTFFVALEERGVKQISQPTSEMSGWLLKKKRKRMQGWAKRWFQIDNGILSYFKDPESPCRGKVHLVISSVTFSQNSRMIFIDSGTMLYHLKAFTEDDYSAWTNIIKAFKASEQRNAQDTVHRMTTRDSTHQQKRAQLRSSWISNNSEIDQLKQLMTVMDAGFVDINEQLESIRVQTELTSGPPTPISGSSSSQRRERQPSVDGSPTSSSTGGGSGSGNKFMKKFSIPSLQRTTSDGSIASTQSSIENVHARLQASFQKLKSDKERTFEIMRSEMEKWEKNEKQFRQLLTEASGKDQNASSSSLSRNTGTVTDRSALSRHVLEESAYIAHTRTSMTSERTNSFTSSITGSDIFYDADDTILTADLSSADLSDLEGAGFDDQGNGNDDDDSDDESGEEIAAKAKEEVPAAPEPQKASPQETKQDEEPIVRRTVLPAPVSGEDISLLSILRKNVGKDLSTVAMPVSLNEPINVLQRLCEELEYSELLDKAASLDDSLDRMVYVAAFAVSGYATTQWRAARKPFNPLHGETFEYVCPEKGFKFISEKVSHYPPVMACHADSVHHWSLSMDSRAKTKFWGKSMELMPNGTIHIRFNKSGDHYTIIKPSTWMRNLMAGTKYLEHTGELKIINHTTRETCVLTFKESSFFAGTKHEIVGHVMTANGAKKRTLQGRWSESLMEEVAPNKLERLWKCNTPPPNHEKYYGFTEFTIHLNELTKGLETKLPKTDTRFRPDQSLFERGRVEEADQEKLRVEQRQRELRKAMESRGEQWDVRWFEKKADPQTEDPEGQTWVYKGGYWEARETGEWNEKVTLW